MDFKESEFQEQFQIGKKYQADEIRMEIVHHLGLSTGYTEKKQTLSFITSNCQTKYPATIEELILAIPNSPFEMELLKYPSIVLSDFAYVIQEQLNEETENLRTVFRPTPCGKYICTDKYWN
jgi:hypothetical protein